METNGLLSKKILLTPSLQRTRAFPFVPIQEVVVPLRDLVPLRNHLSRPVRVYRISQLKQPPFLAHGCKHPIRCRLGFLAW
jgi:hypothetical protein